MISVYQLKSRFQNLLRPITKLMANLHITANMVTIAAFILSIFVGVVIYFFANDYKYLLWILPITLLVRMGLNAIDGMLAREHNQQSNLGAILNELGDILSDIVIYVPFLHVYNVCNCAVFLYAILTIISETVGIMGVQINASRRYDGPMGKSDRAFWISVLAVAIMYTEIQPKYLSIVVYVFIALLCFTIWNRIVSALKEAK